jgi:hypothetical protein
MTTTTAPARPAAADVASAIIDALAKLAANRRVYIAATLAAACIFWLAPRLPMTDLPQHVAQIALWHDLLMGQSPWAELFQINLLTPYLTVYSLALGLSFVVSATTAFKILLTVGFIAYVISCCQLRRDFGADQRLDWLFIPSYFGVAYEWGFATFLISTPLCLQFIRLARVHAASASWQRDLGLVLLGMTLLVSHGLLFLFAGLIGGAMVLEGSPKIRDFARRAAPYALLGVICAVFLWASRQNEAPAPISEFAWPGPFERIQLMALQLQSASTKTFLPITMLMVAAIVLLRPRHARRAAIPFGVVTLVFFLVPHTGYGTAILYQRFAMFILPFCALACLRSDDCPPLKAKLCHIVLMCGCISIIAIHAARNIAFAREGADFEAVLAAAEPGRRAANMVLNYQSAATGIISAHLHQPSWYQVEKQGLVEFNFAYFHPMVVRYNFSRIPYTGFGFHPHLIKFDWASPQARIFDYFFVRQHEDDGPPAELIANPACALRLVKSSGLWSLYERGACKP